MGCLHNHSPGSGSLSLEIIIFCPRCLLDPPYRPAVKSGSLRVGTPWRWKNDLMYFLSTTEILYNNNYYHIIELHHCQLLVDSTLHEDINVLVPTANLKPNIVEQAVPKGSG